MLAVSLALGGRCRVEQKREILVTSAASSPQWAGIDPASSRMLVDIEPRPGLGRITPTVQWVLEYGEGEVAGCQHNAFVGSPPGGRVLCGCESGAAR
jgi:hypothetical protein